MAQARPVYTNVGVVEKEKLSFHWGFQSLSFKPSTVGSHFVNPKQEPACEWSQLKSRSEGVRSISYYIFEDLDLVMIGIFCN